MDTRTALELNFERELHLQCLQLVLLDPRRRRPLTPQLTLLRHHRHLMLTSQESVSY